MSFDQAINILKLKHKGQNKTYEKLGEELKRRKCRFIGHQKRQQEFIKEEPHMKTNGEKIRGRPRAT